MILSKASKLSDLTFDALQPSITFLLKATKTPGIPLAAMWMAHLQFSIASATGLVIESCDPVTTTGILIFLSMNESMEEV